MLIDIDNVEYDDLKEFYMFNKYSAYREIGEKQYAINIKKNFGVFWQRYTDEERKKIFEYLKELYDYKNLHNGKLVFVSMEKVAEVLTTGKFKGGRGKLWRKTKYILRWDGSSLPKTNRKDID